MKEDLEPDPYVVKRPQRGLAVVAMTFVLVGALAYWAYQRDAGEGERLGPPPGTPAPQTMGGAVATSGAEEPRNVEGDGGQPAVVPPGVIQELETITGSVDGQQLVGRRVDLHVTVRDIANDVAFWVGEGDNRVLVVIRRDNRDGHKQQIGRPASHGISTVHAGQQASISGSVQRLPKPEEMSSWSLTQDEAAEVMDRKLFIRADTVTTNGHGTH